MKWIIKPGNLALFFAVYWILMYFSYLSFGKVDDKYVLASMFAVLVFNLHSHIESIRNDKNNS